MASHHHHCQTTHSTTSCCCCRSSCSHPTSSHHSPPPPSLDPLVQALASQLLLQPPQPQYPFSPYLKPNTPHHFQYQQQTHRQKFQQQQDHHHQQEQQQQQTHAIVSSLLHRIDALESSLHHLSSSSSSSSSCHRSYSSLRDVAARTIQTHFRAYLVRRSRTLRHLKELAIIKSSFNTLKSLLSAQTHFDPEAISHRAMDLLLKLDSIQGGDPMIRDGKKSISRDLVRFLEFIDGFSVKRHELSNKAVKNARFVQRSNKSRVLGTNCRGLGGGEREILQKFRGQVKNIGGFSRILENDDENVELQGFHQLIDDEENPRIYNYKKNGVSQIGKGVLVNGHGGQSRVKKSVSFADNGNDYRVFVSAHESSSSGDSTSIDEEVSFDDQREQVESLCKEVEQLGGLSRGTEDGDEDAQTENVGSPKSSDGERNPRRNLRTDADFEISGYCQGQDGDFVFSAPLPVKMESRADLMKKRKAVKIGT